LETRRWNGTKSAFADSAEGVERHDEARRGIDTAKGSGSIPDPLPFCRL
jgi:hypothetical protein